MLLYNSFGGFWVFYLMWFVISASTNKFSYCLAQPLGGFLQIFLVVTNAQEFSIELLEQLSGFWCRHPNVWWGESCGFRGSLGWMTKDEFINFNLTYMGDLSKIFSRYKVSYSCTSNASWISPIFIEKIKMEDIWVHSLYWVASSSYFNFRFFASY